MTWLSWLFNNPIVLRFVTFAAIVGSVLLVLLGVRRGGRLAERAEIMEANLNSIRRARATRNEVDSLPDGAAFTELLRDWHR